MANRNQVPNAVLPLAPLEYDVQHQNMMMRSLNFALQQAQNPGHARMVDVVMTQCPTKPLRDNGSKWPEGQVWNDEGFLKILPDGNPGNVNANTVNANTVNATTGNITTVNSTTGNIGTVNSSTVVALSSVTTPDLEATVIVNAANVNTTGAYYVDSTQVVANQQPAIPNATDINTISVSGTADLVTGAVSGSGTTSSNIVTVVNDILIALRAHGLIAP